jgi:hypothetical protein
MQICSRCVLPETFPGIDFDEAGVCSVCRQTPDVVALRGQRQRLKARMDEAIERVRGGRKYDCLVAFSGGKDSSYTLKLLVQQYGLSCLALTIDNGFLSDQALRNCRAVTRELSADFSLFTPAPDFMRGMYRASIDQPALHTPAAITRASAVCNSCISLINAQMLQTALAHEIPLIAGGYLSGQVPKDAAVLELDIAAHGKTRSASLRRYAEVFGPGAVKYFRVDPPHRAAVGGATAGGAAGGARVTLINPMLTVEMSEEAIIEEISQLGWRPSPDTGRNSSNCRLNDLGVLVHHRRHGFNPYVAEIAEQVRLGLMDRETALAKAAAIPAPADVSEQAAAIGIQIHDFR